MMNQFVHDRGVCLLVAGLIIATRNQNRNLHDRMTVFLFSSHEYSSAIRKL